MLNYMKGLMVIKVNKYEKALDLMSKEIKDDHLDNEFQLLDELVSKATPTKPIWVYNDESICPYCREPLDGCKEHCVLYGQRIDWSENE